MLAPGHTKPPVSRADELAATTQAAVLALADRLDRGHTAEYLDVLAFWSRLHRYSYRNLLLIRAQRPDASRVAGYTTWRRLGRQVARGSTAIWIWAPVVARERDPEDGGEIERCVGFRPAAVYAAEDLVDIAARPLPSLWRPLPDDVEPLYRRVAAAIWASGVQVAEAALPAGVHGRTDGRTIVVAAGLDSRNRLATLLHEWAHQLAHFGPAAVDRQREQCELEAESTAYVVLRHLGIEYPFAADYLLTYKVTPARLWASLAVIAGLTRRMFGALEEAADEVGHE